MRGYFGVMSQENVEIVRRLFDAVARRDAETVLDLYDPEVEWDASRSPLGRVSGTEVYRGHAGIRRAFREWYDGWEQVEDEVKEVIDAGDTVIVVATLRTRGRSSGIEVELADYASTWTLKDRRIVRVVWFATLADALGAVGDQL